MNFITYILNLDNSTQNEYYLRIKEFTDELVLSTDKEYKSLLNRYISFLKNSRLENIRSWEEYYYDLLMIGVVWNLYLNHSINLSYINYKIFSGLIKLRNINEAVKKYADLLRGVLATLFLTKSKCEPEILNIPVKKKINKLIRWMYSTNEFREEVKRVKLFAEFIDSISEKESSLFLLKIINNSNLFSQKAKNKLGIYTKNVEKFIKNDLKSYKWKEDFIFCGRSEIEYHLSMLGAELMNRAFKTDFNNTTQRAVLLPACMRLKQDGSCKALKKDLNLICTGCADECNINKYRKAGKVLNYKTFVIPHSSNFSNWLKKWAVGQNIGVVGVACPLNLITGGLELKALDIPAQCLLLDYCGCKNHWSKTGIPTNINEEQLKLVLKKI
ncbi:MAG: DUF116 domain-containing protein [bacterium]